MLAPGDTQVQANAAWLDAVSGNAPGALEFLSRLSRSSGAYLLPVKLAMIRRALGDEVAATNLLRIAEVDKAPWRLLAWCDPRLVK